MIRAICTEAAQVLLRDGWRQYGHHDHPVEQAGAHDVSGALALAARRVGASGPDHRRVRMTVACSLPEPYMGALSAWNDARGRTTMQVVQHLAYVAGMYRERDRLREVRRYVPSGNLRPSHRAS